MKRLVFILLAIYAGLFCVENINAATPKKVAVYVEGNLPEEDKTIINTAVMSRLSSAKDYKAYERNKDFVNALMKEHDYQLSGEVSDSEIRAVGERLGVDYVIAVDVIEKKDRTYMSCRLIDLETGEVLKTTSQDRDGTGIETLKSLANNCAYRLLSKTSK